MHVHHANNWRNPMGTCYPLPGGGFFPLTLMSDTHFVGGLGD